MRRIPSLDGLRAVSISLVVVGHWVELHYHSSTGADVAGAFANLGVRIFFVISGYLITTLLLKEYGKTSTIGLREFYVRRAYRILPAAIVFMVPVFVIFWHELRWYHMAAAALYLANFDFSHPWFLGHLWSLSVEEQFYFLWPGVLKKWHRHRVGILVGVVAFAPVYRVACHFLGLHGRADETFPAVADVLAMGCLLAIFAARLPKVRAGWALAMIVPVVLVPMYWGAMRFHTTAVLLLVLWPAMHVSIAGLLLHVVERPYWMLNVRPVVWLGKISYSLYLWQQLFAYGDRHRPWYFVLVAVGLAGASYYLVEQPMLRLREKRAEERKAERSLATARNAAGYNSADGIAGLVNEMKSALRFAMLALVLVIVAMVSGLTAMRFAIHGQEVAVPALVGLSPAEAERATAGLGLQISIERQYYSPQIPEGRIMSQLPLPGTKVRRGWQVRVAQSLGKTRVTIPDVTGQSEHAAELNIRRRGLDVASMAEVQEAGIPADQVLAQSPTAHETQVAAPKISFLVSADAQPQAFVMPTFVGQPLGSASRSLQDSGFRLGNVSVALPVSSAANDTPDLGNPAAPSVLPGQPTPASIIVSQVPVPGQKVNAGSAVNFEVR